MSLEVLLESLEVDVRRGVESVCERAGTWDADWCILKAAGELIAKPRLPRVSPENLVEGKWYVVRKSERDKPDWDQIMEATEAPGWDGADLWLVDGDDYLMPKDCFSIWGPIPEFELEGE